MRSVWRFVDPVRTALICYILILAVVQGAALSDAQGNPSQLPAALMFTAGSRDNSDRPPVSLVYVDPKTFVAKRFYTDQKAAGVGALRALRWSPQGNFLAIYRRQALNNPVNNNAKTPQYLDQICILDRSGVLKTCFDDPPSSNFFQEDLVTASQLETMSWSADEQSVYFAAADGNNVLLVEGDVNTGKRHRVLYEEQDNTETLLNWTTTLVLCQKEMFG